jgi:hypothetical protein
MAEFFEAPQIASSFYWPFRAEFSLLSVSAVCEQSEIRDVSKGISDQMPR